MANVYIEPRPKGRPEGNPTDDYVVGGPCGPRPHHLHAIFCDSMPRVSQISGRRVFVNAGVQFISILRRFGTAFGHKPRLYAGDQRLALESSGPVGAA